MTRPAWQLLLLTLLLSGCAGSSPDPPESEPALVDVHGVLIKAGHGLLEVRVVSDAGLAIPEATVSVLGQDAFGQTDDQGNVTFANVTAGQATIETRAQGFEASQSTVDIAVETVTQHAIVLIAASVEGGLRAHVHDHWAGQDTYQLLDSSITLEDPDRDESRVFPDAAWAADHMVSRPNRNLSRWILPIVETPHGGPPIVLPGTIEMKITLTWEEDLLDVLGLCYETASGADRICRGTQASPATWTIPVLPEDADDGHQPWSMWELSIYHPPATQTNQPVVARGDVNIEALLTKGQVVADPPHPEFWNNGSTLMLLDYDDSHNGVCCSNYRTIRLDGIVPPGTTRMRVEHGWTAEDWQVAAGWDYQLRVRTGDLNPHTTSVYDWAEPASIEGAAADKARVYELEVSADQTDGYYQATSNWALSYYLVPAGEASYDMNPAPTRHTFKVLAINDAL